MKRFRVCRILAVCGAAAVSIGASPAATADDQNSVGWSITPYLWAPTTKVDLKFQNTSIADEVSFNDLLDTLDQAFMLHVEGGKGNWSFFGDVTYLNTSEVNERTLLAIDSRSKQTFVDAALSWWPAGVDTPFSVFGGLRYSGFDDRYTFRLIQDGSVVGTSGSSSDYYDALLGLRYRFDLSDRWSLLTHADMSFGDSEGTFLLRANLAWAVGQRRQNKILFGYQYKQATYEDNGLKSEFRISGPMAGFSFRF